MGRWQNVLELVTDNPLCCIKMADADADAD
jgi:hypothetical protein